MDASAIRLSFQLPLSPPISLSRIVTHNSLPSISPFRHVQTKRFNLETGGCPRAQKFDEGAFEAERLRLDAAARESMAESSKRDEVDGDPKAWKWVIRKRIWDIMEARNFAQNPCPVHHRIPNFVGAAAAAQKVRLKRDRHFPNPPHPRHPQPPTICSIKLKTCVEGVIKFLPCLPFI